MIALFGPTASGKTAVGRVLRERLGARVISADSAALYAGLPILTAAPDYPAALVGTVPLDRDVSVGEYQQLAHAAIDAAERPLLVGGTGLYFRAAVSSLTIPPPGRREHWQAEVARLGPESAHALLARRDPAAAARVHANDRKRVVRALELAAVEFRGPTDRLWATDARHETLLVGIAGGSEESLRARIEAQVAAGVAEEARRAWSQPLSATARKILGLEQFATMPLEEAIEAVLAASRRLARYQRKWLRRLPVAATLAADRAPEEVADEILALAGTGERLPRR